MSISSASNDERVAEPSEFGGAVFAGGKVKQLVAEKTQAAGQVERRRCSGHLAKRTADRKLRLAALRTNYLDNSSFVGPTL